jgi:hypothetical protein
MSSKYFECLSFEIGSTDKHRGNTSYTITGDKEYIDKIRSKPVQLTTSYTLNGWLVLQYGYSDGTLKSTAEKMQGVKTIKIETITPKKLSKFIKIEIEGDYNPYMPLEDNASYVEVSDRLGKTNAEFSKIDSQAEQPYQRKFSNSSILSIEEFLRDTEFESLLKEVKL